MAIKEIHVRTICPCNGKKYRCSKCRGTGYIEEWVPLRRLIDSIEDEQHLETLFSLALKS